MDIQSDELHRSLAMASRTVRAWERWRPGAPIDGTALARRTNPVTHDALAVVGDVVMVSG